MTDDSDWIADLEAQPVFILAQLQVGHVLTESDRAAIQAVLSELDSMEWNDVDTFQKGRVFGHHEAGGQELADAIERKDKATTERRVREAMGRMDAARGVPTERERFRDVLAAALDEHEQQHGRLTDPDDPHWTNTARQIMKDTEPL